MIYQYCCCLQPPMGSLPAATGHHMERQPSHLPTEATARLPATVRRPLLTGTDPPPTDKVDTPALLRLQISSLPLQSELFPHIL